MQITAAETQIRVNGYWIPFGVFENGKYKDEITKVIEEASCQQDQEIQAMVVAEAFCADMRFIDRYRGVYYHVKFRRGERTIISTYIFNNGDHVKGTHVKDFAFGSGIDESWKGDLEHVLDI